MVRVINPHEVERVASVGAEACVVEGALFGAGEPDLMKRIGSFVATAKGLLADKPKANLNPDIELIHQFGLHVEDSPQEIFQYGMGDSFYPNQVRKTEEKIGQPQAFDLAADFYRYMGWGMITTSLRSQAARENARARKKGEAAVKLLSLISVEEKMYLSRSSLQNRVYNFDKTAPGNDQEKFEMLRCLADVGSAALYSCDKLRRRRTAARTLSGLLGEHKVLSALHEAGYAASYVDLHGEFVEGHDIWVYRNGVETGIQVKARFNSQQEIQVKNRDRHGTLTANVSTGPNYPNFHLRKNAKHRLLAAIKD